MMKEIAMHIMDIVQNSVKAGASLIEIIVAEKPLENLLIININDNGCGMSTEMLEKVKNPFVTTRTTRKVGLGIPMLEQTCNMCGGSLYLWSREDQGTRLEARMEYSHIDRPPLGDVGECVFLTIISNPDTDFVYQHIFESKEFTLDTREIREALEGVPLNEPSVMEWIKGSIEEGLAEIKE